MQTRIVSRAVVYDSDKRALLLVRNKDDDYWYIPGGGWEADRENILECAVREVKEETGLDASIGRLLYMQEFHASPERIIFEPFFLATIEGDTALDANHIDTDPDGSVGEARWFTREDLEGVEVYPTVFKDRFWEEIDGMLEGKDRFLGVRAMEHGV
jgi:ADP-ribose pyrophosphatase YjhB (NUDIX family)